MRFDDVGLFWKDLNQPRATRAAEYHAAKELPPIPDTGWVAPEFPNLRGVRFLGLDTETRDPHLTTLGPGWGRGDGEVVGVSLATEDASWYFPFGHTVATHQNLDRDAVLAWLKDTLEGEQRDYAGTNLQYDFGWLRESGIRPHYRYLFDVQIAEPLLDEYAASYSLNALAGKYLGESKVSDALYEWLSHAYGGPPTARAQGGNIHRAPPCLVGPYAEADAMLPMRILAEQRKALEAQELMDLFMLETRLLPLLLDMRWRGVRVDVPHAERLAAEWEQREHEAQRALDELAQTRVDVWSAGSLANAFDRANVPYPRTGRGEPSFTQHFLASCQHPAAVHVLDARKYSKARSTFVQGYVLDKHVNGVLHGSFHQLRRVTDESGGAGTVSGRLSSSDPNLQNIPSRDEEIGPAARSMFVPFEGDRRWRRYDYSQIEFRLLVHYATGPGANDARQAFTDAPDTDYHEMVRQQIHRVVNILLERKPTKNINFGLVYGMGKPKLRGDLGLNERAGEELFAAYHEGVPFVRKTFNHVMNRALNRGYIKTVLGRRARFELWEPVDWEMRQHVEPLLDRQAMIERVNELRDIEAANGNRVPRPGVQRAYGHKALNRLLQGGAADVIKKAMVDQYESGVFDVVGVPLVTVHDELGFSDPCTTASEEAFRHAEHIMENCVPLRVPLRVDCEVGPNWGDLHALER